MGWEIPASGQATEKPPVGNHRAVLVGLFDMGRQWQEPFNAGDKGYYSHRAFFVWELCDELVSGTNNNHVIGIDLTLSVKDTAKLYKWVKARTGKAPEGGFNPMSELGQACLLSVIDNKGYPKVDGMSALPKAMSAPAPTYKPTAVSLDEFRGGTPIPEWCPWLYGSQLADHIRACEEIGGTKPEPKKGSAKPPAQQSGGFPTSTSAPQQHANNPDAKWDVNDGTPGGKRGLTSVELQEAINSNQEAFGKWMIKPAGAAPGAGVGTPKEYGFTDVIPF
jgi:hypothetical protein